MEIVNTPIATATAIYPTMCPIQTRHAVPCGATKIISTNHELSFNDSMSFKTKFQRLQIYALANVNMHWFLKRSMNQIFVLQNVFFICDGGGGLELLECTYVKNLGCMHLIFSYIVISHYYNYSIQVRILSTLEHDGGSVAKNARLDNMDINLPAEHLKDQVHKYLPAYCAQYALCTACMSCMHMSGYTMSPHSLHKS